MSRLHVPHFILHLFGDESITELEKQWREVIHRSPNVAQESVKVSRDVQKMTKKSIDVSEKIISEHKSEHELEQSEQLRISKEAIDLLEKSKRNGP